MGRGQACDGKQEVPAKTAQWVQVTLKVRGWPALDQNSRPGQARPAHIPSQEITARGTEKSRHRLGRAFLPCSFYCVNRQVFSQNT